jgi:hypothetical protein
MEFIEFPAWNRRWHRLTCPGEAMYSRVKRLLVVRSRRIQWLGNPTRTCPAERRWPRVPRAGTGRTRGDLLLGKASPPKQARGTQRSGAAGSLRKSESRGQSSLATRHRLASTPDKPIWEGPRGRCSGRPRCFASTCCSCVLPVEAFEDGTFGNRRASVANPCEFPQSLLHGLQAFDLGFYVGNLGFRPRPDIRVGCTT